MRSALRATATLVLVSLTVFSLARRNQERLRGGALLCMLGLDMSAAGSAQVDVFLKVATARPAGRALAHGFGDGGNHAIAGRLRGKVLPETSRIVDILNPHAKLSTDKAARRHKTDHPFTSPFLTRPGAPDSDPMREIIHINPDFPTAGHYFYAPRSDLPSAASGNRA